MPQKTEKNKGTKSSSFGVAGRINHDSSQFYNSKLYSELTPIKNQTHLEVIIPNESLNQIYHKSSETMDELPDNSIHLMITSPPYNVKKEYDEDLSLDEYRKLLKRVMSETFKKLVTGGRACINIANLGRKPYIPLHSYIIEDMLDIGYLMRGEIIWNKAHSASPSTAWGSWLSSANAVLRDIHEYILVFSKDTFSRKRGNKKDSITREEFLEFTKSIWTFPAVSAKSVGHPAPFPEELPYRLIQLYSFEGDVVLDPFCGSGTTCITAVKTNRNFIGYEINREYVQLSNTRIQSLTGQKSLFEES